MAFYLMEKALGAERRAERLRATAEYDVHGAEALEQVTDIAGRKDPTKRVEHVTSES